MKTLCEGVFVWGIEAKEGNLLRLQSSNISRYFLHFLVTAVVADNKLKAYGFATSSLFCVFRQKEGALGCSIHEVNKHAGVSQKQETELNVTFDWASIKRNERLCLSTQMSAGAAVVGIIGHQEVVADGDKRLT